MRLFETSSGGRVATGKTPWGDFCVEWDADGKLVSESIELRTPSPAKVIDPTPEQRAIMEPRRAVCETCPENNGLTLRTVKCKSCGCSGVSLLRGDCKLSKWA